MDRKPYPGEKSCGEIILNKPFRRSIFLEDLIGTFALVIILMMFR